MTFTAKLDAIEFFRDGGRHIRVYYQFDDDTTIRESCYHQDYGWFVRGDGVVISNAKNKSPITATRWTEDGGTTKICVFYLDDQDNICQCQGTHQLTSQWTSTTIGAATETEIAPDSQLAIARPDKDDQLLRLFYQGKSSNGNAGPLCEIRYDANDHKWLPQDNPITTDAINRTGLSAVSDKATQAVRLYYQGSDLVLREIYCDGDYRWSTRSLIIQKQNKLSPNAPISAICWRSSQSRLQIHIFTVLSANITAISHISYDHPNWKTTTGPDVPYKEHSGIATCRNTGVDTMIHSPICRFYQSGLRAIDFRPVPPNNAPESKQMAEDILLLMGIPTSLDGAVPLPKDSKNSPQQEPRDKSNDKDKGAGSDVSKKLAEALGSLELERNEKSQMEDRLAKALESLKLEQEAKTRLAEQLAKTSNDLELERDEKTKLAEQLAKDAAAKPATPSIDDTLAAKKANEEELDELRKILISGKEITLRSGTKKFVTSTFEMLQFLYRNGFDIRGTDTTGSGRNGLHLAVSQGIESYTLFLLRQGADIDATNLDGQTPLHCAVEGNNKGLVSLLLDEGAKVYLTDNSGKTPLHSARSESIACLLINHRASLTSRDNNDNTPLHYAIYYAKDTTLVPFLLEQGADVNSKNNMGRTPLWNVESPKSFDQLVSALLEKGADINSKDIFGLTPFHRLICEGRESVAQLFLDRGANVDNKCESGETTIDAAVNKGFAMVEFLIKNKAKVDTPGRDGRTALFLAIGRDDERTVKLLLANGADRTWKTPKGETPLQYAQQKGSDSIARLLE